MTTAKDRRTLFLAACAVGLLPAILSVVQELLQAVVAGRAPKLHDFLFGPIDWLFLAVLAPIPYQLSRRFPLRRHTWRPELAHFAGAVAFCFIWALLGAILGKLTGQMPTGERSFMRAWITWALFSIPWGVLIYFTILGSIYAYTYFVQARENEAQAARLSAQLAQARLGALRSQLNPHFLFNSLNALAVLVRENNARAASQMLELLSDVLRRVLSTDEPHEIPLADELRFVEQYLAIEQVRFSDRLRITWSIEEDARGALVPGFVLQPLVENAIKHGVSARADAGRIEIVARVAGGNLEIAVRDDGVGMQPTQREGVGLTNTRERLRTLYADRGTLTLRPANGGGTEALVTIPLRGRAGRVA